MNTLPAKPHFRRRNDGSAILMGYRVPGSQMKAAGEQLMPLSWGRYPNILGGSWTTVIDDPFPGAWQQNVTLRSTKDLLAFPPIYACVTLIAGDIAKLRMRLTALLGSVRPARTFPTRDIWLESEVPTNSPFLRPLRKPNDYQTPYQFWTAWIVSRLLNGNAYILKTRDNRGAENAGNVTSLHVLDPGLVEPLVAETGEVFYKLRKDYLTGVDDEEIVVPASEIIHDRVTPLWHPLVGVSPLYAAALSGTQGVNIATNATRFFGFTRSSKVQVRCRRWRCSARASGEASGALSVSMSSALMGWGRRRRRPR